jgi:hypothetical protein
LINQNRVVSTIARFFKELGETINDALEDTLRSFMASLERVQGDRTLLREDDLEWSACEDF